jgi:hypothetical protein
MNLRNISKVINVCLSALPNLELVYYYHYSLPVQDSKRQEVDLFVPVGDRSNSVVVKMAYRRYTWLAVNIVETAAYVPEPNLDNRPEYIQHMAEEPGQVQQTYFPWYLPQEEPYSIREIKKL